MKALNVSLTIALRVLVNRTLVFNICSNFKTTSFWEAVHVFKHKPKINGRIFVFSFYIAYGI